MSLEAFFLYFAFIIILILIIVKFLMVYLFRGAYKENKTNKLLLGVILFFLFMALGRIGLVYFDFSLTQFQSTLYQQHALT